jgi:hypothetical protein
MKNSRYIQILKPAFVAGCEPVTLMNNFRLVPPDPVDPAAPESFSYCNPPGQLWLFKALTNSFAYVDALESYHPPEKCVIMQPTAKCWRFVSLLLRYLGSPPE